MYIVDSEFGLEIQVCVISKPVLLAVALDYDDAINKNMHLLTWAEYPYIPVMVIVQTYSYEWRYLSAYFIL